MDRAPANLDQIGARKISVLVCVENLLESALSVLADRGIGLVFGFNLFL